MNSFIEFSMKFEIAAHLKRCLFSWKMGDFIKNHFLTFLYELDYVLI